MSKTYRIFLLYSIAIGMMVSCSYLGKHPQARQGQQKDSIALWLDQADTAKSGANKRMLLHRAYQATAKLPADTLKTAYLTKLSLEYLYTDNTEMFNQVNQQAIALAQKLKDSSRLVKVYWDRAFHFSETTYKNDSAYYYYYQAQQLYEKTGNAFYSARMLLGMGNAQIAVNDYRGAEATLTKAIRILTPLKKYRQLYNGYNYLGIIANRLEAYDEALENYTQALEYLRKTPHYNNTAPVTLNNIGLVYKNRGDYDKALENYSAAQQLNQRYAKNPKREVTLSDNMAYIFFKKGETSALPGLFIEALAKSERLNYIPGMITLNLHLAEYYQAVQDIPNALGHAREALRLAIISKNNEDWLTALLLLSKLEKGKKSVQHLDEYIHLSDSLQKRERALQDQFARIRFNTDQLIIEKEKISKERNLILNISVMVIAFGSLLAIIYIQKSKNRELRMEKLQQKTNEEIYTLMLGQQDKIEEARKKEKQRISEELHDGVLGRLFGTRLMLGNYCLRNDDEAKEVRIKYIEELQHIEEEIRGISHDMNIGLFSTKASFIRLTTELLESQSKISKFIFSIDSDKDIVWDKISGDIKTNLYRIIQEAIQNINKYAKANLVSIIFEKEEETLIMTLRDNGVGFEPVLGKTGIGLKNMKFRVLRLKGKIMIKSGLNKGVFIHIKLPINL